MNIVYVQYYLKLKDAIKLDKFLFATCIHTLQFHESQFVQETCNRHKKYPPKSK